jgi:prefoldin subunit 5
MTPNSQEPPIQQLHEEIQLLRGELDQLGKQLDRVDARTTITSQALDDIETYVTQTAQLARDAAEQAAAAANGTEQATSTASGTADVKTGQGVDMGILVPWVENNITTLIARKVPTTDGAPKWCPCWWDHAEAIARLEAARQAWVALSGAGGTALVTYFDYLDRVVLAPLTSDTGPFARCGPRQHTVERPLGHTPPPPEVYADPTPPATPNPLHPATAT